MFTLVRTLAFHSNNHDGMFKRSDVLLNVLETHKTIIKLIVAMHNDAGADKVMLMHFIVGCTICHVSCSDQRKKKKQYHLSDAVTNPFFLFSPSPIKRRNKRKRTPLVT